MGFLDSLGKTLGTVAKAASPILGATNPWLGVGASLLGGALSGNKGGTESTDPNALAAGFPTRTPEQAEMTNFAMPYLKGWMTNPFQISSQPVQKTNVTVGGKKLSYTPGTATSLASNIGPVNPSGAVSGNAAVPTSGPLGPQRLTQPAGGQVQAAPGSSPELAGLTQPAQVPTQPNIPQAVTPKYLQNGLGQNSNQLPPMGMLQNPETAMILQQEANKGNYLVGTAGGNQLIMTNPTGEQWTIPMTLGGDGTWGAAPNVAPEPTPAQPVSTMSPGGPGSYFQVNPGSINLPEVPTFDKTAGTQGQYAGQPQDTATMRNQILDSILNPYKFKPLQEGYDASYLNQLAEGQLNPLKEGYSEALMASDADFNRRGLRASTLPVSKGFGSQPDSITRNYLNAVGDVERDVNLRGMEAAREDRFRNEGMSMDTAKFNAANQLQNQQLLGNLNQTDEGNRQWWSGFGQGQQEFDINNVAKNWEMQNKQGQDLLTREDNNNLANQNLNLSLQKDNIGYQQDALNSILSFIYGLNPEASRAQQNYSSAMNLATKNQANQASQEQDVINWLTDLFKPKKSTIPPSPVSTGGQFPNNYTLTGPDYSRWESNWNS